MKKIMFSAIMIMSLMSFNASASPKEVSMNFKKVYVPEGFDSNDNVQFVGEGLFPNSCYKPSKTLIQVDHKSKTITVNPVAYEYEGLCLQVILPFDRVVDVGVLEEGHYSIHRADQNEDLGKIEIAKAKTVNADDYVYAPVDQAFFQQNGTVKKVHLTGQMPLSCMSIKEVVANISTDVIILQPIVEIDRNQNCQQGQFSFETSVDVSHANKGRYLIHVRSMNGKAINSLIDVN